jgi:hypothetical protein
LEEDYLQMNPGKPLKRLYVSLYALTTVVLLIIFLLFNNPYIVSGTIIDKITPLNRLK